MQRPLRLRAPVVPLFRPGAREGRLHELLPHGRDALLVMDEVRTARAHVGLPIRDAALRGRRRVRRRAFLGIGATAGVLRLAIRRPRPRTPIARPSPAVPTLWPSPPAHAPPCCPRPRRAGTRAPSRRSGTGRPSRGGTPRLRGTPPGTTGGC